MPLADAANLSTGQKAKARCSLLPDKVFEGEVTRITGEADLQRNTLQAKVRIIDPSDQLRPEMLCRVEFMGNALVSGQAFGSLATWVPQEAVADGAVWIGAGTPHAFVGMDDEVAESVPLLTLSTPHIGHFQISTRGTLGGAIAHADPAAEYAAVAVALDAEIEATSARGTRRIAAADFFTGLWETSLAADEILTAVAFPAWSGRCGFSVQEFARRHGDFAIAGATVAEVVAAIDRRIPGVASEVGGTLRLRSRRPGSRSLLVVDVDASTAAASLGLGAPVPSTGPAIDENEPSACVDSNGDVWLFWKSRRSGAWKIWYARFAVYVSTVNATAPVGSSNGIFSIRSS